MTSGISSSQSERTSKIEDTTLDGITATSVRNASESLTAKHLVITVHGIRTFGEWQERLEALLKTADPDVEVYHYKYGYFSILAFITPFLRWLVTRRFRRELIHLAEKETWERIDIVAHSFGTHLAGWGLHGIRPKKRPNIHTILLAGSVLKAGFSWPDLVGTSVDRVVNDCGVRDKVLLLNQLVVLFTGMAGREGFSGMTGYNFRNRYFVFGHSGYFQVKGKPDESFMREKWLPILLTNDDIPLYPDPRPTTAMRGLITFLVHNAEPIKLVLWITPLLVVIIYVNQQRLEAERSAREALARQLAIQASINIERWPERGLLLAVDSVAESKRVDGTWLPEAEQALRDGLRKTAGGVLLPRHGGFVRTGAFDPLGRWFVTGGTDGVVRLWDPENLNAPPAELRTSENNDVWKLAFVENGRRLITGSLDRPAERLWDLSALDAEPDLLGPWRSVVIDPKGRWVATHERKLIQLRQLKKTNAKPLEINRHEVKAWSPLVTELAIDPNGQSLAAGYTDGTVRLWDISNPLLDSVVLRHYRCNQSLQAISFGGEGRWLAAQCGSWGVMLYDLSDKQDSAVRNRGIMLNVNEALQFDKSSSYTTINDVLIDPKGRWIAITSSNLIGLWDLTAPTDRPVILRGQNAYLTTLAFGPVGRWFATGYEDGATWLWDLDNLTSSPVFLRGHEDSIDSLAFDPRGELLVTIGGGTARLWNLSELYVEPRNLRRPEPDDDFVLTSVSIDVDGRWLAAAGYSNDVMLWDLAQSDWHPKVLRGHKGIVNKLAFAPKGRRLATAADDYTTRLWDLSDPDAEPIVLGGHPDYRVVSLAFDNEGRWLASGSKDGFIQLWDIANISPAANPVIYREEGHGVAVLAFDPKMRWLASGGVDGTTRLWNLTDSGAPTVILQGQVKGIGAIAFDPEGQWLATSGLDHTIRLWDLSSLHSEPLVLRGHKGNVSKLAFDPKGRWLATASVGGSIRVWDISDPEAEPLVLHGHEVSGIDARIYVLAFDREGQRLAVGGRNVVRVWALEHPNSAPIILPVDGDVWHGLAFDPKGRWLATVANKDTVRLWNLQVNKLVSLACQSAGRNLKCDEWRMLRGDVPYRPTCPHLPAPDNCQ